MTLGGPKPERLKFLTVDELNLLLGGPLRVNKARDYYLLAVAYYGALRSAEVIAMRSELIRVEFGEMLVPTVKRKLYRGMHADKPTGRPLLPIPILHGDKVLQGAKDWSAGREWMFPSAKSKTGHLGERQFREIFSHWAAVAGLDPRVSGHSLRHSAGTHVQEAIGDDLVLIRDYMRHSNISVTSAYLHTTPDKVAEARAKIKASRG